MSIALEVRWMELKKGNWKVLSIIFYYLRHKKGSLILYILCFIIRMIPDAFGPFLWGVLLEFLIEKKYFYMDSLVTKLCVLYQVHSYLV